MRSQPFDVPWARCGVARVAAHDRSNAVQDFMDIKETRELAGLTKRWSEDEG
jgi:hypothetical protein